MTLRPLNLLGADILVELRREVGMLLNLRHPNVTEFLDQGDAYSAMQNRRCPTARPSISGGSARSAAPTSTAASGASSSTTLGGLSSRTSGCSCARSMSR
jgi:hypothetical protein